MLQYESKRLQKKNATWRGTSMYQHNVLTRNRITEFETVVFIAYKHSCCPFFLLDSFPIYFTFLPFLLSLFLSFYSPINISVAPVDIKHIDLFLLVLICSGFPLLYWLESLSSRSCFAGTEVRKLFISLTAAVAFCLTSLPLHLMI